MKLKGKVARARAIFFGNLHASLRTINTYAKSDCGGRKRVRAYYVIMYLVCVCVCVVCIVVKRNKDEKGARSRGGIQIVQAVSHACFVSYSMYSYHIHEIYNKLRHSRRAVNMYIQPPTPNHPTAPPGRSS